jgi:hypothetical protein
MLILNEQKSKVYEILKRYDEVVIFKIHKSKVCEISKKYDETLILNDQS